MGGWHNEISSIIIHGTFNLIEGGALVLSLLGGPWIHPLRG